MYTELEKELIQEALQVQNACNLSGVVFSFGRAMEKLCELSRELGKGTDWKNQHPVSKLYADKILSLTGEIDLTEYSKWSDLARA